MSSLSDALAQAVAQIEAKVNSALADEVATAVRKDEREALIDKVYSAYNPVKYQRRAYYGGMLDFPGKGAYMKARPCTATTIEMLRSDKSHVAALKAGLKKRGLKVE